MSGQQPQTDRVRPFDEQATQILGRLQHAFESVVRALPDPVERAADLQHALKLDKVLSWRIFNVMRRSDPFVAARYVPGSSAVKNFLRAASRSGVPADVTEAASAALQDYENLAVVHAGDHKRLEMLLASQSEDGRAEIDLSYRRAAFQANSYLWGVSADVTVAAHFVGLSDTAGQFDGAGLTGFIGLQRIRPNIRLQIAKPRMQSDQGAPMSGLRVEPFYDLDTPPPEVRGLLLSAPPPRMERVVLPDGVARYELLPGPVGKTASVNCLAGGIARCAGPRWATPEDECAGTRAEIYTPTELLVFDYFIDHHLLGRVQPDLLVHSRLHGEMLVESERLPVLETVRYMGRASGILHTPEVPRYPDIIGYAFDRLGWDPSRFDTYRFRWEYPIMPSIVTMISPLPTQEKQP